jgi:hypothetical protein
VVLGRSVAGGIAYIPGVIVSHLHPAWLEARYTTAVAYVAPSGRLLALATLIVLCLTGAWNRRAPSGEAVSQPMRPMRAGGLDDIRPRPDSAQPARGAVIAESHADRP